MASAILLSTAAGLALVRLDPAHDLQGARSAEARNIAALALSALIPIYKRDARDALHRMTEEELGAGRFVDGASRFVFHDGRAAAHPLAVRQSDVDKAVEAIAASFAGIRRFRRPTRARPKSPS